MSDWAFLGRNSMNTEDLQENIAQILEMYGWSRKVFAEKLYESRSEDDVAAEDEQTKNKPNHKRNSKTNYIDKVKKDLTKPTVSPDLLMSYLEFLKQDPLYKKIAVIVPAYRPMSGLGYELEDALYKISRSATEIVKKNL